MTSQFLCGALGHLDLAGDAVGFHTARGRDPPAHAALSAGLPYPGAGTINEESAVGYFDKATFSFLSELTENNRREWFTANKDRYEHDLKEPFLDFIADAGPRLHKLSKNIVADPRPVGGSLFRIYRDVRFAKDNRRDAAL